MGCAKGTVNGCGMEVKGIGDEGFSGWRVQECKVGRMEGVEWGVKGVS